MFWIVVGIIWLLSWFAFVMLSLFATSSWVDNVLAFIFFVSTGILITGIIILAIKYMV